MEVELLTEIEREARRVAAAFGLKTYTKLPRFLSQFDGVLGNIQVSWDIDWASPDGPATFARITVGGENDQACQVSDYSGIWYFFQKPDCSPNYREILARTLYRLGFEDKRIWAQLPPLSAHEKLELRLTLPREFWPKTWQDENDQ